MKVSRKQGRIVGSQEEKSGLERISSRRVNRTLKSNRVSWIEVGMEPVRLVPQRVARMSG